MKQFVFAGVSAEFDFEQGCSHTDYTEMETWIFQDKEVSVCYLFLRAEDTNVFLFCRILYTELF